MAAARTGKRVGDLYVCVANMTQAQSRVLGKTALKQNDDRCREIGRERAPIWIAMEYRANGVSRRLT